MGNEYVRKIDGLLMLAYAILEKKLVLWNNVFPHWQFLIKSPVTLTQKMVDKGIKLSIRCKVHNAI